MNENIEKLQVALNRIKAKENIIYFLTPDTKSNPRASVKHIYDMAKTLKAGGYDAKILVEDNKYSGVSHWLGDRYDGIEIVSIKDDNIGVRVDDMIIIPEYYSNVLEQLASIKCVKVMLVQQKDYIFETLPVGSRWSDYGITKVITTTEAAKKYIMDLFPEVIVHILPPIIEDIFKKSEKPQKPYVAISSRNRVIHKRIISEFYLKYPQLRWITFRDMVQTTYDEFAENLKECMVSVWVDDESTFGTFPIESMKCGVPVVGKIPNMEPDWIGENGMWTYDESKIVELLGNYILATLEGVKITDEVQENIKKTTESYPKELIQNNIITVFNSFNNKRIEEFEVTIKRLQEEDNKKETKENA